MLTQDTSQYVNPTTNNSCSTDPGISFAQNMDVLKYRTGTLNTRKLAHRCGRAPHADCLVSQQLDIQIHLLSECQHLSLHESRLSWKQ